MIRWFKTVVASVAVAAMLAPAPGEALDEADGVGIGLVVLGVLAAYGTVVESRRDFDEVREAPRLKVRSRAEAVAGRLGVATEMTMTPRLSFGVWRGVADEDGVPAPAMLFGRVRF